MADCYDIKAICNRLSRIEGHIRGIKNMVEEKKPCEEILIHCNEDGNIMLSRNNDLIGKTVKEIEYLKGTLENDNKSFTETVKRKKCLLHLIQYKKQSGN